MQTVLDGVTVEKATEVDPDLDLSCQATNLKAINELSC